MRLEQQHVLQVYDQIAGHFSATRYKPWPNVLEVSVEPNLFSIVLIFLQLSTVYIEAIVE